MSDRSVSFTIDGKAVAKARPRMTRRGTAYTPASTRGYESYGRLVASDAMTGRDLLEGPIRMHVSICLPIPASWSHTKRRKAYAVTSRPDIDNYLKAAMDICNGIVFRDDAQVFDVSARKLYGDRPRMDVLVATL